MCLWCYSECICTPDKLKNLPDHGGNLTRNLCYRKATQPETHKLQQVSYQQPNIRMCSHRLLRLDDNKSVTSVTSCCKL